MNIPKLRFKEFTDEWVYYKYKDIFNLNQGLQIPITERFLDYAPNRFFYITNEFLKPSSKKSYYIENPSPNVICTKEDILMTRTGNTGKVITNIAGVFHNNFFRIKYNPKNFNKDFICCILNQNKIQNKILTLAGSSTIPDLNHKDFYSIKSRFPKLKEQEKIAKFINTVDKKIENIENTISSLENQKKGLLQQIFSQKLRFKDKNGNNYPNWEKKKLEDIAIFLDNKRKPLEQSERIHGKYPYYGASGIIDYVNNYIFDEELILLSEDGANIIDRNYPICYIATGKYWVNNHAHVLKTKSQYLNKFLCEALERLNYNKYNTGTAQPKLNQDVCRKIILSIPCLEEQTKIADFLSAFDRKLENKKAQLEHWQQIKKGLLQQMFV